MKVAWGCRIHEVGSQEDGTRIHLLMDAHVLTGCGGGPFQQGLR